MGQRRPERPLAGDIFTAVSATYDRPSDWMPEQSCQPVFRAGMYLLRRTAHLRVKEVAVMAGIAAPWVSHIQRAIEQGEVDAVLEQLLERYQLNIYP